MFRKIVQHFMTGSLLISLLFTQVFAAFAQSLPEQQPTTNTAKTKMFLPLIVAETEVSEHTEAVKASTLYASYHIVAVHSGMCLDVTGASTQDQTPIQQFPCGTGANQQWSPLSTTLGPGVGTNISPFNILYVWHSGKCIDVAGLSLADGATVQQYTCNGGANQQWYRVPFGASGNYLIVSKNSGKCLDVVGASLASGARVQQYRCNGGTNQQFRFQ